MKEREIGGIGFIAGRWPLDTEKSTMVFIHGSGGSGQFWLAQVQGLAERVNTVALDLPGHGRSGNVEKNAVVDYARAVLEFIDVIEARKIIPCGLSLGGAIVQQLLLDHAKQFIAGILIGTGAKLKVLPAIFDAIQNDYAGFVKTAVQLSSSEKTDPKQIQLFSEDLNRCRPEVVYSDFKACNEFNVMERIVEIKVPVLVISAQDDKLTPPKYADYLESAIPGADRAHIPDAGHIAPLEKPREINQAIIDFLDRHGL